MQVYATLDDVRTPLAAMPALARRAEALGFDGLLVPEAVSDGVLAALLALEHTERLRVATGVIVAFARSPTLAAQDAWGLQALSGGRFELGLGPQIRSNVEGRFGMPWSAPAARMRDYVGAVRAVFDCWEHGTPLRYESEAYRLDRMQPFFVPPPLPGAPPGILLGAVGPRMARVAGEVADAVLGHPTNTSPSYLREVLRPALAEGARAAGRDPGAIRVIAGPLVATGATEGDVAAERAAAREVLAFTYTTPAYRGTLDHLGRGDLHEALRARARAGSWGELGALLDDTLLDELVPSGRFGAIADVLGARYAGLADAVTLRMPGDPAHDAAFAAVVADLRGQAK